MISIPSPPSDLVILVSCSLPCLVSVFIVAYAVSSLRYHCQLLELKILEKESPNARHARPLASAHGTDETLQEEIGPANPNDNIATSDSASNGGAGYRQTGSEVERLWLQERAPDIQSTEDPDNMSFNTYLQELDTDYDLKILQIKILTKVNEELQVASKEQKGEILQLNEELQVSSKEQEDKISQLNLELTKCRRRLQQATSGPLDTVLPTQTKEELHAICVKQEQKILELTDRLSEYHHHLASGRSSDSTTFLPPSPPYFECSCRKRDTRHTRSAPVTFIDVWQADDDDDSENQKDGECEEGQSCQESQEIQRNEKYEYDSDRTLEIEGDDDDEYSSGDHEDEDERDLSDGEVPEFVDREDGMRRRRVSNGRTGKARMARYRKVRRFGVSYSKRSDYHRA